MITRPGTSFSFGNPSSAASSYALERDMPSRAAMSMTDRNMGSSSLLLMIDGFIDSPAFLIFYVWHKKIERSSFFDSRVSKFTFSPNRTKKEQNVGLGRKVFQKNFREKHFPSPERYLLAKRKRSGTIPNLNLIHYSSSPIGDKNASAISRTPKRKP